LLSAPASVSYHGFLLANALLYTTSPATVSPSLAVDALTDKASGLIILCLAGSGFQTLLSLLEDPKNR